MTTGFKFVLMTNLQKKMNWQVAMRKLLFFNFIACLLFMISCLSYSRSQTLILREDLF